MSSSRAAISFDEEGRLRVLEVEKYQETEQLETECRNFVMRIQNFAEVVSSIVEVLNSQAESIESAKLRAIGQRNLLDMERESRRRKQLELRALIDERQAELARLRAQLESLEKIEREQKELIERLTDPEGN